VLALCPQLDCYSDRQARFWLCDGRGRSHDLWFGDLGWRLRWKAAPVPQGRRRISLFRVRKRSTNLRCLSKTTRSRVRVQPVGLNAETKKRRHRADGEEYLYDIPFYSASPVMRLTSWAANPGSRRTSGGVRPSLAAGLLGRKSAFHRFREREHFVGYVIVRN